MPRPTIDNSCQPGAASSPFMGHAGASKADGAGKNQRKPARSRAVEHRDWILLVDTREQLPYQPENVTVERCKLDVGDYSIKGYEDRFCIERKTLDDFLGSITHERARFFREIEKMAALNRRDGCYAAIIVECGWRDIADVCYKQQVNRESVSGTIAAIEIHYGVPVHFLSDRAAAEWWVVRMGDLAASRLGNEPGDSNS